MKAKFTRPFNGRDVGDAVPDTFTDPMVHLLVGRGVAEYVEVQGHAASSTVDDVEDDRPGGTRGKPRRNKKATKAS